MNITSMFHIFYPFGPIIKFDVTYETLIQKENEEVIWIPNNP